MACLKASLEIFNEASLQALRKKSITLTSYLEFLLNSLNSSKFTIITPTNPNERGCQLSLIIHSQPQHFLETLHTNGFICDMRPPNILRIAPTPLYNTFSDVHKLYEFLRDY